MEWPKITLFGDSITRRSTDTDNGCWGSMVAFTAGSYFDVDVRGFEGYNSKWALELAPKLFPKSYLDKVQVFVLFFGHNDSLESSPMHLSLADYDKNMRGLIAYLVDNGLARDKIIVITPTWYHSDAFLEYLKEIGMPPATKRLEDAQKYCDTVLALGRDERVEVLDFFAVSAKYRPLEDMFCDGIHYSRVGAKLLYDHLMPLIEAKIERAFDKPLAELHHAVPLEQRPEALAFLEAYRRGAGGADSGAK